MQPRSSSGPRRLKVEGERGVYYRLDASGSRRYEITFTDPATGRQRWRVVEGDLKAARAVRGDMLAKAARGERILTPSTATLREVGDEWLAAQAHLRPATVKWYSHALGAYIGPQLGRRKIGTVREDEIVGLIADMQRKGYAAWTVRGTLTVLGRVLGYAARRGMIPDNPVRRLERSERPRGQARAMRILDRPEIGKLLDKATDRYRLAVAFAIFSGLRQGEQLGLKWRDIDLKAGTVLVRGQLDRAGIIVPPKTAKGVRDVPLAPFLVSARRKAQMASAYKQPHHFVFVSETGGPMHYRNLVRRGLDKAADAAGLNPPKLKKGEKRPRTGAQNVRWHDLRHTSASLLISEGCDPVYVSRVLGHASPGFTLTCYAHLFDSQRHAGRMSAALEARYGMIAL